MTLMSRNLVGEENETPSQKWQKNGLAEGMVTRKLCVEVLDLVLTSFQTSFFQHQPSQKSKSLTCCYLVPRFSVTPYLVPIGKVDVKKKSFIHKLFLSFPNKGGCSYIFMDGRFLIPWHTTAKWPFGGPPTVKLPEPSRKTGSFHLPESLL